MHSVSMNRSTKNRPPYYAFPSKTASKGASNIDAHGYTASQTVQSNAQLNLSVRSFYYRSSKKAQLALCTLDPARKVISTDDPLLELSLPSKGVALAISQNPDALRKQIKRTFNALKPILEPFNDNDLRSPKSWKCEIAAIILAFFGKVNKIPKRAKSKIDNIFGSKILLDEETALIKSQLTKQQAENWIKNAYEIREIFQYAGLNPHDVMGILR